MLKLKKINLLIENYKIHNKSKHGCCDHKTCVEKRVIFLRAWLFAV